MGEGDRASLIRRQTEIGNRIDQHAEVIASHGQSLTAHKGEMNLLRGKDTDIQSQLDDLKQHYELLHTSHSLHMAICNKDHQSHRRNFAWGGLIVLGLLVWAIMLTLRAV